MLLASRFNRCSSGLQGLDLPSSRSTAYLPTGVALNLNPTERRAVFSEPWALIEIAFARGLFFPSNCFDAGRITVERRNDTTSEGSFHSFCKKSAENGSTRYVPRV